MRYIRTPASRPTHLYPQFILLNSTRAICLNFITEIEYSSNDAAPKRFLLMGIFIPHRNAAHSHGATDMPPRNGAGVIPEKVNAIHLIESSEPLK